MFDLCKTLDVHTDTLSLLHFTFVLTLLYYNISVNRHAVDSIAYLYNALSIKDIKNSGKL